MLNVGVLFVLAVGYGADQIEDGEGLTVLRRVRDVVIAEADTLRAQWLPQGGGSAQGVRGRGAALRGFWVDESEEVPDPPGRRDASAGLRPARTENPLGPDDAP